MKSDRILGLVVIVVALAFFASALQVKEGFFPDPVGSKAFPIMISVVMAICGAVLAFRPDPEPDWPGLRSFGALAVALVVLVAYAYALKPLGFLIPTALAASAISYLIQPRIAAALMTGVGLSGGLFIIFKFVLKLGLVAWPKFLIG